MQEIKKEIKKELEDLINWVYKSSFADIFTYNRADQTTKLSEKAEEKVNKIIKRKVK